MQVDLSNLIILPYVIKPLKPYEHNYIFLQIRLQVLFEGLLQATL